MLWLRGMLFTVLVPGVVAFYIPYALHGPIPLVNGTWSLGWLATIGGALLYFRCLIAFLAANGTPAIFFTRPLGFLLGEEPQRLVRSAVYKYSRNPMYVGVVAVVSGEAIAAHSRQLGIYAVGLFLGFHTVVTLLEEPHLRRREGAAYAKYTSEVSRWISWRRLLQGMRGAA